MGYASLAECIKDLERTRQLVRISCMVDPDLEMAEIHRRVHAAQGPAILYERVKGSPFPAVSNLFGTKKRAEYLLRHALPGLRHAGRIMTENLPGSVRLKKILKIARILGYTIPREVKHAPVAFRKTSIGQLPSIRCWPEDGGGFILLPQVYTENPARPGVWSSNIGMYRIQLGGNDYAINKEIGLHYQIRRDIASHHAEAIESAKPLKVSIFVGGPPAHTLAAVMPAPEGMSEVLLAGMLACRRFRYAKKGGFVLSADADFCITGTIDPCKTKPEGPFGDHLGYYSLKHPFPYIKVKDVYCRKDAVWPFTVVGRPPQEDSVFGWLVHELTAPLLPAAIPGLCSVNAVDAAGVHPLLFAVGRERYIPYAGRKPRELLKIAHGILGFGPLALAKYLFIAAKEDDPHLDTNDPSVFLQHVLSRFDPRTDLHFETRTSIDTLDYSGGILNEGSKLVVTACGEIKRRLGYEIPPGLDLPLEFSDVMSPLPGVLVVSGPPYTDRKSGDEAMKRFCSFLEEKNELFSGFPLIVVADEARMAGNSIGDFLWVTFTRSNPASDVWGAGEFHHQKHWGCSGPVVIDARMKPHHAPVLEPDPVVAKKVDEMGKRGGPLHGII